jgi:uncharacterized Zn finger protein (UPF0148 family)
MYQEKIVGQPCSVCGQPYVMGKKGVYCVACYKVWANQNKPQSPQTQNLPPQQGFYTQGIQPTQYITKDEYESILARQRESFKEMSTRIAELTQQVEYLKEIFKKNEPSAFIVHEDAIPVIGKENFTENASKALGL